MNDETSGRLTGDTKWESGPDALFSAHRQQEITTAKRNGYHEGYAQAHKDFVRLCERYKLNPAGMSIHKLIEAAVAAEPIRVERNYETGEFAEYCRGVNLDPVTTSLPALIEAVRVSWCEEMEPRNTADVEAAFKNGVNEGRAEVELENAHRKPVTAPGIEGPGFTVRHVGHLTLIVNNYGLPPAG